jgi:hypothetical protein
VAGPGKRGRGQVFADAKAQRAVLAAMRDGCSLADAAIMAGCVYTTLYHAMKRDANFSQAVRKAEIEGKRKLIKRTGEKRPEWLLAVKWSDEFGRKDRYTLKQIDEVVQRVSNRLMALIPEDRRMLAESAVKEEMLGMVIQGGEIPENGDT